MSSEGRTTRSSMKKLNEHEHSNVQHLEFRKNFLTEATLLTPVPNYRIRQNRRKRQFEDPVDHPPPTPSSSRKKTRYGDEVHQQAPYLSPMDVPSSTTADTPLSAFHNEDITLELEDLWPGVDGLASGNDPFLPDVSSSKGGRDLHTPTPPMSPRDDMAPMTPKPRPGTPDYNSLPSSMDSTMRIMEHEDDDNNDTHSLVAGSTLSAYGPPPTPMCQSRVGNLSSSSNTSSLMQLSTVLRTSPSTTSAAPPLNILASDDDDDEDVAIVQINKITNNSKESPPHSSPPNNQNNLTTDNKKILKADSPVDSTPTSTSDVVGDPQSHSQCNGKNSNTPKPASPMSPPVSSISKHSRRLRIRAPLSMRSGHKKTEDKSRNKDKVSSSSHSIRSILRIEKKPSTTDSNVERIQSTEKVRSTTVVNAAEKMPSTTDRNTAKNCNPPRPSASVKISVSFAEGTKPSIKLNIKKGGESCDSMLMPPPKPKTAVHVKSSLSSNSATSVVGRKKSKTNGAIPLAVRTAAFPPPEIFKNNSYVRDGCIIHLKLFNFMAHGNKCWDFSRGVTFINGKNGSGKSAIQLGIKILVGEKAVNTLRTSSVKFFIKKGYPYAEIEGHFTNYNGAISKKRYGEVLKIKRRIKSGGGSNYSIIDHGRWRPIKQYELSLITHSLNIDPNNPFQFLQQDRSKDSNKQGSSHQSNRDFIKFNQATQLTAIEEMLSASEENLEVAKKVVRDKEEMKRFFTLQRNQLQVQLDLIIKMEMSENRLTELETELAWSKVQVLKDEQCRIGAEKAKSFSAVTKLKEEKRKLEEEIANFSSMEEKNKRLVLDVRRQLKQLETEREAKAQEMREVKRTQQRAQSQHGAIITKIRQYTEEIDKLERELNKETISYEAENEKLRAEIETYLGMIDEKQVSLNALRLKRDKILSEINEYKATQRREQSNLTQLESQLNETKRELTKKDNFGRHMKELQARIEKYKNWRIKPIGPLGQHILVPDAQYAPLIEHILYHALFTFITQTTEDFNKLKELIKEVYNDKEKSKQRLKEAYVTNVPNINIKDYMGNVKRVKDKVKGFRTVLGMVTTKDPMVEVGLIELTNCEKIILFDSNKAAAQVMKDETLVPKEVSTGYTLQWFKVRPSPRYQFQPISGRIKCTTEIIPMAKGETITKLKEEIASKRETMETCRFNLKGSNGLEIMLRENDKEIQAANKQINQLKNQIKHAESRIREEPTPGQDRDVKDQIRMVEEMRGDREKEIEVPLKELELAKEKATRLREEMDVIDTRMPEVKKKLEELEGDHSGTNHTVTKLAKEIEDYKARILRIEKEFQTQGEAETTIYFELEELQKKALKIGPCPKGDTFRAPQEVQRELEDLRQFLLNNRDKLMSKKRVSSEFNNSNALVLQITNEITLINNLCVDFKPLIKVNSDYYETMKKDMSYQLTQNFKRLVEAHGLTGDLIIDWENKTLVYYVCPDKDAEEKAAESYENKDGEMIVKDKQGVFNYVQNLSGGERSKALVFFIMAMWRITDMPFHVLDEFEACLDFESRDAIHDKIIQHAKQHPESQFFIITPLNLPQVSPEDKDFVQVIEIKKSK